MQEHVWVSVQQWSRGGHPERIAWDFFFFNNVCRAFQLRHLINRLWRSVSSLSVSDPCSCAASVFWVCAALVLKRMVGIQNRLLNCICTKTTDPHTRRASLPASQQVGQPPNTALTTLHFLFLLFASHNIFVFLHFSWLSFGSSVAWTIKKWSLTRVYSITHSNTNKHSQTQQTHTLMTGKTKKNSFVLL